MGVNELHVWTECRSKVLQLNSRCDGVSGSVKKRKSGTSALLDVGAVVADTQREGGQTLRGLVPTPAELEAQNCEPKFIRPSSQTDPCKPCTGRYAVKAIRAEILYFKRSS